MERQTGVWLQAALLLAALIPAGALNTATFCEVGGKIVLTPAHVSGRITSIVWKFKGDLVAEWYENSLPLDFSPRFKDRASVNTTTGVLEVSDMNASYSGVYTVEVNNVEQAGGYDVSAIRQVPEPAAILRPVTCNPTSKQCTLSCIGDIAEAGLVTFYFKLGDGNWEPGQQNIEVTKENSKGVETFSCRMKNSLGQKDSKPLANVFYEESNTEVIVGSVIGVVAAAAAVAVVGYVFYRKRTGGNATVNTRPSPSKDDTRQPEGTPLKDATGEASP